MCFVSIYVIEYYIIVSDIILVIFLPYPYTRLISIINKKHAQKLQKSAEILSIVTDIALEYDLMSYSVLGKPCIYCGVY